MWKCGNKLISSKPTQVINISISCCLTSLIILSVAMLLSVVGMWHKQVSTAYSSSSDLTCPQATCLLVSCVLLLLAVFFFSLHVAVDATHAPAR